MADRESRIADRVGRSVRRAREARGWSQAELAERLDVSVDFVGMLERGERSPSLETLVELARVLDLGFEDLLGEARAEEWEAGALRLLRAVPDALRPSVLAMLRTAGETPRSGRQASRRRRT